MIAKMSHRRGSAFRPKHFVAGIAWGGIALFGLLGAQQARAQDTETQYPHMAPVGQYLMDRDAEIALARSAAPEAISREATVLVLGRNGFETAVKGSNGFVCMVQRVGSGAIDWPEFWSPKIRAAECLNPIAARSMVPIYELKTRLALAGDSKEEIMDKVVAAFVHGDLPALGPGAMSYMMSKGAYLSDSGSHAMAHVMFYVPVADAATWGARQPDSPIGSADFWFNSPELSQKFKGLPTIRVFTVKVPTWSDGTPADHSHDQ